MGFGDSYWKIWWWLVKSKIQSETYQKYGDIDDQVAEMVGEEKEKEKEKEIVGMIRGCIKTVTCGKKLSRNGRNCNDPTKPLPVYTKLAYILGLRVSPSHR